MSPKILERSRPRVSVQDFTQEEILAFLQKKLTAHSVREAYLFGSFAAGTTTPWSDLDVLVVNPSAQPFIERPREFFDLHELGLPLDLLVYTPEEFARIRASDSPFWREFARHHRRII
jgi:predicted nucleotidyltransferase